MANQTTPEPQRNIETAKRLFASSFCLAVCAAGAASAHDLWIQTQRFWLAPKASTPVSIYVGHGRDKQLWDADIRRIIRLTSIGPKGSVERSGSIRQGGTGMVSFTDDGFHIVALETNAAISQLPAARFNDYLATEGLTTAIAYRAANNQTQTAGIETYSRRAKLLMRVGNTQRATSDHVTRPLGLTLEIVPEQNPYTASNSAALPFRIYFEGRPLSGATVMLNDLRNEARHPNRADARPAARHVSDANGRVAFAIPRRGQWQMNVVWTKPLPARSAAQFETTFSSLTFGFDPRPAS